MSIKRILAIALIYLVACGGWSILGTTTMLRSDHFTSRLQGKVYELWGRPLVQEAPVVSTRLAGEESARYLMPRLNVIRAEIDLDYRKKGLVWYPTYNVRFQARYTVSNPDPVKRRIHFHFAFPVSTGTYDGFSFERDGKPLQVPIDPRKGVETEAELLPGKEAVFSVAYRTRGLESWVYRIDRHLGRVQGLDLQVQTDFTRVDYPDGSLSPTAPARISEGNAVASWTASDLITHQDMGIAVPARLNPGPLAGRITYFAPVCLIFFFILMGAINVVKRIQIHPMHYLFVAAGFAAFHVLFAYLVDHVNIHLAFAVCATVSVTLVTSYMSSALEGRFPWKAAVLGQIFFLVLFSYSFFLEGMTGLTVAVGSVITLAVLMRLTAHIDWNQVFGAAPAHAPGATPAARI